jgi:6-phosphogluconolactonase/glucosamine-6-phosphate isomerase/deaminase
MHDKFAVAVPHAPSFERVTSTPRTIIKAERIVFLAIGKEKEEIVAKFQREPDSIIAGQVVKNALNIELWFTT